MPAPPSRYIKYDFQNPACYPGSGSVIDDLAGNTDLTVVNGNWVSGAINYWDLLGNTDLANTAPPSQLLSNVFTVNIWYYPNFTNPYTYGTVWAIGINGPGTMPILSTVNNGTFNLQWSYGYYLTPYTPSLDWHMVTFVSTGSQTVLYIDGVLANQTAGAGSIGSISGVTRLRLGSTNQGDGSPGEYAYGKIGYWDYFTFALNASQVMDVYNDTKAPYIPPVPFAGIVGGRQFNQGFNG